MEKDALNASFQWKVSVCIFKEDCTWINQVAKDNLEKQLKEKEESAKEIEKQLQARIDELEAENIEFKLDALAQHDSSKESISDDQTKENTPGCKGKLICIICQEKFTNKAELKAHISKKHKWSSQNSCPHCYKDFRSKKSLNIHIDSAHFDDKSIVNKEQCDHCQQKFGTTDELETHMEKCYHKASVTNGSQGNHKWNDKALEKYTGKKSNERQPNSEKAKHQCEICNAIFPRNQILVKHITLDHPEAQLPEQSVIELPVPTCKRQPKKKNAQQKLIEDDITESKQSKADCKKYKCALCSASSDTKIKRIAHIGDEHKGAQKGKAHVFICAECGFQTFHETGYKHYMDTH